MLDSLGWMHLAGAKSRSRATATAVHDALLPRSETKPLRFASIAAPDGTASAGADSAAATPIMRSPDSMFFIVNS